MKYSKLVIPLLLLGVLALAACAPGGSTGTAPTAKPTRLHITYDEVTQPTPAMLLLEDAATVQNIYTSAVALPVFPSDQGCAGVGGRRYALTFLKGKQVIATAVGDDGGCTVTFGKNDVRHANAAFWQRLGQAVTEAIQALQPDKAEVVSFTGPQEPPMLSTLASEEQARQLYTALHALPTPPEAPFCPQATGVGYTLVFFEAEERTSAQLDTSGCISGPADSERHQADAAFWHLLKQTLTSAPTAPARPDTLDLKARPASNDPSSTPSASAITNQERVHQVFDAIYALPQQPVDQTCPTVADTIYDLTFFKDGVELLEAIADKSGCGTVTSDGYKRIANRAFWNLVQQAQTA